MLLGFFFLLTPNQGVPLQWFPKRSRLEFGHHEFFLGDASPPHLCERSCRKPLVVGISCCCEASFFRSFFLLPFLSLRRQSRRRTAAVWVVFSLFLFSPCGCVLFSCFSQVEVLLHSFFRLKPGWFPVPGRCVRGAVPPHVNPPLPALSLMGRVAPGLV